MLAKYEKAKSHFKNWVILAGDDTEELVAVIYWYVICCVKDRDVAGLKEALALYSPDMYIGHHAAYRCGIARCRGGVTPAEAVLAAEAAEGETRDLDYGMIIYAVANYEYMRGSTASYIEYLDKVLSRDTFWAGFASLAALNDRHPEVASEAARRGDVSDDGNALYAYFSGIQRQLWAFRAGRIQRSSS
jgi:hypothetical protein